MKSPFFVVRGSHDLIFKVEINFGGHFPEDFAFSGRVAGMFQVEADALVVGVTGH